MNLPLRNALLLGLAGFLSAVAVDLDAWSKYPTEDGSKPKFNLRTASQRWVVGFLTGFVTGITAMGSEL